MILRHHSGSNSLFTGCLTWQQWSPFVSQRASSPTKAYQPCRQRWTGSLEGCWQLREYISSILPNQFIDMASQVCIGLACTKKDDTRRNGNGSSKMIWRLRSVIAQSVLLEGVSKLFLPTVRLLPVVLTWTNSSVETLRQQPAYDLDRRRRDRLDWPITLLRHLSQVSFLHVGNYPWNYLWHRCLVVWFQMLPHYTCKFMLSVLKLMKYDKSSCRTNKFGQQAL